MSSNNSENNLQADKTNFRSNYDQKDILKYSNKPEQSEEVSQDKKSGTSDKKGICSKKKISVQSAEHQSMLVLCLQQEGTNWMSTCAKTIGKSQLQIKKHYLKMIRNAINNLNTSNHSHVNHKQFQPIANCVSNVENNHEKLVDRCRQILYRLLLQDLNIKNQQNQMVYKDLVEQIKEMIIIFKKMQNRKYLKKSKTTVYSYDAQIQQVAAERGYMSDCSSVYEDACARSQFIPVIQKQYESDMEIENQQRQQIEKMARRTKGPVIVAQKENQIKDILFDAGLLHFQVVSTNQSVQDPMIQNSNWLMNSEQWQNSKYGCLDGIHHFYQQNQLNGNCYWKVNLCAERDEK